MESKLYSMAHTKMKELQDHDMSWIEVRRGREGGLWEGREGGLWEGEGGWIMRGEGGWIMGGEGGWTMGGGTVVRVFVTC